ncbi:MAG: TetR/AcrR family transcriptional regulator, partial [Saprospiraceae bacterium]
MNRRDHILSEAAKIIKAQGYAGATMRDIAEAVGVEVSSLYNHISSKQEILSSICFSIGQEYIEGLTVLLNNKLSYKKQL